VKFGKHPNGAQRYACHNEECSRSVFQLDYKYRACESGAKFRILEMVINGSGVRDIARVLHISTDVVIDTLKKENWNQQVNLTYLKFRKDASEIVIELVCVEEGRWMRCGLMFMIKHSVGFGMQ
jgi:transposase-like protein